MMGQTITISPATVTSTLGNGSYGNYKDAEADFVADDVTFVAQNVCRTVKNTPLGFAAGSFLQVKKLTGYIQTKEAMPLGKITLTCSGMAPTVLAGTTAEDMAAVEVATESEITKDMTDNEGNPISTTLNVCTYDLTGCKYLKISAMVATAYINEAVIECADDTDATATVTAVFDGGEKVLAEGETLAEANSFTIVMPKEYQNAICAVDKLVYDAEDDYTYEETINGSLEQVDATTWSFTFDKQPQNFATGFQYKIKVRGWEGEIFGGEDGWTPLPCDETLFVINGAGEQDKVEVDMSFYDYEVIGENENYEVSPNNFGGVTIKYPWNNVAEVYGEEDFFQWGAVMLKVTEAYLYELDENFEYDVEHPVAEEHNASSSEYDEVTVFSSVKDLKPNTNYVVIIPQRGIRLLNMMEYGFDDSTMDGVLWTNSIEWDTINISFTTCAPETGINGIAVDKNAVKFNIAGQRVGNDAKGIVIVNGKKIVKK